MLFGAARLRAKTLLQFPEAVQRQHSDTGAGFVDLEVRWSPQAGASDPLSFEVTYTMQTVNLAIQIPEGEVLHARAEPYEVVTRHIIGENANGLQEASLTLLTSRASANPT